MKNIRKKFFIACASIFSSACIGLTANAVIKAFAKQSYGDTFDYTQSQEEIKYKSMQSDGIDASKKGLLLYAYESGATATFKGVFSGTFETEVKALSRQNGAPDLKNYSLLFTDNETKKTFSISVIAAATYTDVYVSVDGNKGGIVYYDQYGDNNAYGFTAAYNEQGQYTRFTHDGVTKLSFDPETMQVKVQGDDGAYRLVWDFTQEFNDGKRLLHDLSAFREYSVTVCFDEISLNGKGELLLYTFGEHSFDSKYIDGKVTLNAKFDSNAIVGQTYELPKAKAVDLLDGILENADIDVCVYNEAGKVVNGNGAGSFVPENVGNYYIYYTYGDASRFYMIQAVEQTEAKGEFAYEEMFTHESVIGLNTTLYIPECTVESTLSLTGKPVDAVVTLKKDGELVEGYENVPSGFAYKFDALGEYEVVYSTEEFGDSITQTKTVGVSSSVLGVEVANVPETACLGDTLSIEAATMYINGKSGKADVTVEYPSGKTVETTECVLDELGYYSIVHTYEGERYEQQFVVNRTYSDLFSGVSFSAKYGAMKGNNTVVGQMLTLTNNNVVVYEQLIDLADNTFDDSLEDQSQNTPLIKMLLQPEKVGMADLTGLYITLTDVNDENNYIIIRMRYQDYSTTTSRVRTKASGQAWVGYYYDFFTTELEVNTTQMHEDGGMVTNFSHTQIMTNRQFEDMSLELYFDNDAGRLYAKPDQKYGHTQTGEDKSKTVPWLVRDYKTTDPVLSAGDTPWKGFSTGEVYLSIYATGVSDTAQVMITNIDGEDLTAEYIPDTVAPNIDVELGINGVVPFAETGMAYPVFAATANDSYSPISYEGVEVFFGDRKISVQDGVFTPETAGEYTLVYTAIDAYGNKAEERVTVTAKNNLDNPQLFIDGSVPETTEFGSNITLPDFYGFGGAGNVKASVQVLCGGKEIPVENGRFSCLGTGSTYIICYTATDYIGQTKKEYQYIYGVERVNAPIIDEGNIVLPAAFMNGERYVFADQFATYYSQDGKVETVKAKLEVTDGNGTKVLSDNVYTPTASDNVKTAKIRYIFERSGAETSSTEREIPILVIQQGIGFLSEYFIPSNATVEAEDNGVFFAPISEDDFGFSFIRSVEARHLTVMLNMDERMSASDSVIFRLTDKYNALQVVEFVVEKSTGGYVCRVNGGAAVRINADGNNRILFRYEKNTGAVYDVYNMKFATVTDYANGAEFKGFDSNSVYFDVSASYGCGRIGITTIANQGFSSYNRDDTLPIITVNGDCSGRFTPGSSVVLPSAIAYDVLNDIGSVTVTVRGDSGIVMEAKDASAEQVFIPETYGSYTIMYRVSDSQGNQTTVRKYIVVYDDVKPTLTFSEEIEATAKRGDTITLPNYTVNDNGDLEKTSVKVYVCSPDGINSVVDGNKVTFKQKGKYTVYYLVIDESENVTYYAFGVKVE